jgi:hypothetical protein
MPANATRRRRLVGVVFLAIALLLALAGQTVLRPRLDGVTFLFYWMGCFVALGLAVATALLDILVIRHEARREQIQLLRQTFERASNQPSAAPPPTRDTATQPAPVSVRSRKLPRADSTSS